MQSATGFFEIVLIVGVVLVIVRPKHLPEIMRSVARGRKKLQSIQARVKTEIDAQEKEIQLQANLEKARLAEEQAKNRSEEQPHG